ncbi:hypothetical protein D9615_003855 [Tricholomella constricta]|uniref:Uncharacterized protein n=1 Tax=Tricholomella constricta TaxID=117010 RepID=A0A8H5HI77_9AGAR|nr:hypothetical protein D9615_003855 [Tricholomella constricta]
MRSRGTFRDRRPDSIPSKAPSTHREDQQPNETINKRQRIGPPSILPVSVPGRAPQRGDNHKSRAGGWTQHAIRANKTRQGAHANRGGYGHGAQTPPFYKRHPSTSIDQSWHTPSTRRNNTPAIQSISGPYISNANQSYVSQSSIPTQLESRTDHGPLPPSLSSYSMSSAALGTYSQGAHRAINPQATLSQPIGNNILAPLSTGSSAAIKPGYIHRTAPSQPPKPPSLEPMGKVRESCEYQSAASSSLQDSTLPLKRRRLDCASEPPVKMEKIESLVIDSPPPPIVKHELQSPSPPSRRLITQSCSFYPLPDDCRKMNPNYNADYVKNRNALCAKERGVLKRHGLMANNVLFRDDGMVIEWTSSVPVWSDTLLPEPPKSVPKQKQKPAAKSPWSRGPLALPIPAKTKDSRRSYSPERETPGPSSEKEQQRPKASSSKDIPLTGRRDRRLDSVSSSDAAHGATTISSPQPNEPPPPSKDKGKAKAADLPQQSPARLPFRRPLPLPKPRRAPVITAEPPLQPLREAPPENERRKELSVDIPSVHVESTTIDMEMVSDTWNAEELTEVEAIAVDYLQRYIKAFDADISTLRGAYAPHATFSLRMPPLTSPSSDAGMGVGTLRQGPDDIHADLEHLRSYKFCPVGIVHDPKGKEISRKSDSAAWWWKDVVVRKSLLEECAGDRFERLLLSVSTHTFLKGTPSLELIPENINLVCVVQGARGICGSLLALLSNQRKSLKTLHDASEPVALLRSQPMLYAELLTKCETARHTWAQAASLLLQREADLRSLREHLRTHGGEVASKYSTLSTDRLVATVKSKYQDLLCRLWSRPNGQVALDFLVKASGLEISDTATTEHVLSDTEPKSHYPIISPQPLPVAAAHHPLNLKKIRKPIFLTPKSQRPVNGAETAVPGTAKAKSNRSLATVALSDLFHSELRRHQALNEALSRVRTVGRDLITRTKALEAKRTTKQAIVKPGFSLNLWEPALGTPINFDTQPTPELLATFDLHTAQLEGCLEARIDEIRDTILPAYPPLPNLCAPRVPAAETARQSSKGGGSSNIPRAAFIKVTSAPQPSSPPRVSKPWSPQLLTSTPPATIKLRSRKVVADQEKTKSTPHRGSKVPRKSIRFSLAIHRRPSLFAAGSQEDMLESDVIRIIRGTQDGSMEEELPPMTPKAKRTPVNRIFTGTKGGSTIKRPKHSFPMVFQEPAVPLPSLVSASTSFDDLMADSDEDSGSYTNEESSMTLREILLSSDTTQFDLLEGEQSFGDESFDWESVNQPWKEVNASKYSIDAIGWLTPPDPLGTEITHNLFVQPAQSQGMRENMYADGIIRALKHELLLERQAHAQTRARVHTLEAQVASRDAALETWAQHTGTSTPSAVRGQHVNVKGKGKRKGKGPETPRDLNRAEISSLFVQTRAKNRTLEQEVRNLFRTLENARLKTDAQVQRSQQAPTPPPPPILLLQPDIDTLPHPPSPERGRTKERQLSHHEPPDRRLETQTHLHQNLTPLTPSRIVYGARITPRALPQTPSPRRTPSSTPGTLIAHIADDADHLPSDQSRSSASRRRPHTSSPSPPITSPNSVLQRLDDEIRLLSAQIDAFRAERAALLSIIDSELRDRSKGTMEEAFSKNSDHHPDAEAEAKAVIINADRVRPEGLDSGELAGEVEESTDGGERSMDLETPLFPVLLTLPGEEVFSEPVDLPSDSQLPAAAVAPSSARSESRSGVRNAETGHDVATGAPADGPQEEADHPLGAQQLPSSQAGMGEQKVAEDLGDNEILMIRPRVSDTAVPIP